MKSNLLRLFAALFALALVAAACGSDDEAATDESTETTVAADGDAEAGDAEAGDAEAADAGDEEMTDDEAADEEMTDDEAADEEMTDDEAADEEMTDDDIVTVAINSGEFPTLVAAVEAAGLVDTLQGDGPFTVLAPTEEAFAAALTALDMTAEELLADTDLLNSVLTYHVIPDAVGSEVVVTLDGADVATVNGATISVSVDEDGSVLINEEATVIQTDITGSNGVIHVIDAVLLPPAE